jgi:hypothetical protein
MAISLEKGVKAQYLPEPLPDEGDRRKLAGMLAVLPT